LNLDADTNTKQKFYYAGRHLCKTNIATPVAATASQHAIEDIATHPAFDIRPALVNQTPLTAQDFVLIMMNPLHTLDTDRTYYVYDGTVTSDAKQSCQALEVFIRTVADELRKYHIVLALAYDSKADIVVNINVDNVRGDNPLKLQSRFTKVLTMSQHALTANTSRLLQNHTFKDDERHLRNTTTGHVWLPQFGTDVVVWVKTDLCNSLPEQLWNRQNNISSLARLLMDAFRRVLPKYEMPQHWIGHYVFADKDSAGRFYAAEVNHALCHQPIELADSIVGMKCYINSQCVSECKNTQDKEWAEPTKDEPDLATVGYTGVYFDKMHEYVFAVLAWHHQNTNMQSVIKYLWPSELQFTADMVKALPMYALMNLWACMKKKWFILTGGIATPKARAMLDDFTSTDEVLQEKLYDKYVKTQQTKTSSTSNTRRGVKISVLGVGLLGMLGAISDQLVPATLENLPTEYVGNAEDSKPTLSSANLSSFTQSQSDSQSNDAMSQQMQNAIAGQKESAKRAQDDSDAAEAALEQLKAAEKQALQTANLSDAEEEEKQLQREVGEAEASHADWFNATRQNNERDTTRHIAVTPLQIAPDTATDTSAFPNGAQHVPAHVMSPSSTFATRQPKQSDNSRALVERPARLADFSSVPTNDQGIQIPTAWYGKAYDNTQSTALALPAQPASNRNIAIESPSSPFVATMKQPINYSRALVTQPTPRDGFSRMSPPSSDTQLPTSSYREVAVYDNHDNQQNPAPALSNAKFVHVTQVPAPQNPASGTAGPVRVNNYLAGNNPQQSTSVTVLDARTLAEQTRHATEAAELKTEQTRHVEEAADLEAQKARIEQQQQQQQGTNMMNKRWDDITKRQKLDEFQRILEEAESLAKAADEAASLAEQAAAAEKVAAKQAEEAKKAAEEAATEAAAKAKEAAAADLEAQKARVEQQQLTNMYNHWDDRTKRQKLDEFQRILEEAESAAKAAGEAASLAEQAAAAKKVAAKQAEEAKKAAEAAATEAAAKAKEAEEAAEAAAKAKEAEEAAEAAAKAKEAEEAKKAAEAVAEQQDKQRKSTINGSAAGQADARQRSQTQTGHKTATPAKPVKPVKPVESARVVFADFLNLGIPTAHSISGKTLWFADLLGKNTSENAASQNFNSFMFLYNNLVEESKKCNDVKTEDPTCNELRGKIHRCKVGLRVCQAIYIAHMHVKDSNTDTTRITSQTNFYKGTPDQIKAQSETVAALSAVLKSDMFKNFITYYSARMECYVDPTWWCKASATYDSSFNPDLWNATAQLNANVSQLVMKNYNPGMDDMYTIIHATTETLTARYLSGGVNLTKAMTTLLLIFSSQFVTSTSWAPAQLTNNTLDVLCKTDTDVFLNENDKNNRATSDDRTLYDNQIVATVKTCMNNKDCLAVVELISNRINDTDVDNINTFINKLDLTSALKPDDHGLPTTSIDFRLDKKKEAGFGLALSQNNVFGKLYAEYAELPTEANFTSLIAKLDKTILETDHDGFKTFCTNFKKVLLNHRKDATRPDTYTNICTFAVCLVSAYLTWLHTQIDGYRKIVNDYKSAFTNLRKLARQFAQMVIRSKFSPIAMLAGMNSQDSILTRATNAGAVSIACLICFKFGEYIPIGLLGIAIWWANFQTKKNTPTWAKGFDMPYNVLNSAIQATCMIVPQFISTDSSIQTNFVVIAIPVAFWMCNKVSSTTQFDTIVPCDVGEVKPMLQLIYQFKPAENVKWIDVISKSEWESCGGASDVIILTSNIGLPNQLTVNSTNVTSDNNSPNATHAQSIKIAYKATRSLKQDISSDGSNVAVYAAVYKPENTSYFQCHSRWSTLDVIAKHANATQVLGQKTLKNMTQCTVDVETFKINTRSQFDVQPNQPNQPANQAGPTSPASPAGPANQSHHTNQHRSHERNSQAAPAGIVNQAAPAGQAAQAGQANQTALTGRANQAHHTNQHSSHERNYQTDLANIESSDSHRDNTSNSSLGDHTNIYQVD